MKTYGMKKENISRYEESILWRKKENENEKSMAEAKKKQYRKKINEENNRGVIISKEERNNIRKYLELKNEKHENNMKNNQKIII